MVVSGLGDALMKSWVIWGGSWVGRSFLNIIDLRWVTAPRLVFGTRYTPCVPKVAPLCAFDIFYFIDL